MNVGRVSNSVNTYPLGKDAMAKARVIDMMVQRVLRRWPDVVYSDSIGQSREGNMQQDGVTQG